MKLSIQEKVRGIYKYFAKVNFEVYTKKNNFDAKE